MKMLVYKHFIFLILCVYLNKVTRGHIKRGAGHMQPTRRKFRTSVQVRSTSLKFIPLTVCDIVKYCFKKNLIKNKPNPSEKQILKILGSKKSLRKMNMKKFNCLDKKSILIHAEITDIKVIIEISCQLEILQKQLLKPVMTRTTCYQQTLRHQSFSYLSTWK